MEGERNIDVRAIVQNENADFENKCLKLLELWIDKRNNPKWRQLIQAAEDSEIGGLARTLTTKLGSEEQPQNGREEQKRGKT